MNYYIRLYYYIDNIIFFFFFFRIYFARKTRVEEANNEDRSQRSNGSPMENGDRKRRSGAIVSRFSQLYFFSSDHPRKDASVWTLAVTPAHKCSFSRPRGVRGRAVTEYLWSSRHFSRAPAAAGAATPVQRPRFRRSRSGKHVAETPSYCRYQARFLYKPCSSCSKFVRGAGSGGLSVFGRTTTKWSNHRCPFHVGGSARIRSNNGGREFRDLLSPFRDETLIRRERGGADRTKYGFPFCVLFEFATERGTLIKPPSSGNGLNSDQFVSASCILMLISDVREEDLLTPRCFRRVTLSRY